MTNLVEYMNGLSAHWMVGMWNAVWQSTVLALGILLLTLLLKRTPSSVRFGLWMLVPLRLLLMPMFSIYLPLLPAETLEVAQGASFEEENFGSVSGGASFGVIPEEVIGGSGGAAFELPPNVVSAVGPIESSFEKTSLSGWAYLMMAWICGVGLVAMRMSVGYWKTRRIVKTASEVTTGHVFDSVREAAEMLELRRVPRVVLTDENVSPFVLGALRPVVVLPSAFVKSVSRGQLLAVLAHEAAHLRRNDFAVGWVMAVCEAMYFFHPAVHLVNRRLILEREKACDDWVLVASHARPSQYAQALLSAAGSQCFANSHLKPQAVVAESFTLLKQRMASIAATVNPKAGLSARASVLLCVLGALCIPGITVTAKKAEVVEVVASVEDVEHNEIPAAIEESVEVTIEYDEVVLEEVPPPTPTPTLNLAQQKVTDGRFRVLHFPKDASLGNLSVRRHRGRHKYQLGREMGDVGDYDLWEFVSEARGDVRVPSGSVLRLNILDSGLPHIDHLQDLAPDDLHTVIFEISRSLGIYGEQVLPFLKGLTGLKDLRLHGIEVTGRGLHNIEGLRKLERLNLGAQGRSFADAELRHLQHMDSLRVLTLYVPVQDDGLKYLTALPALRELRLQCQNLRGPGLASLANVPSLRLLELDGPTNTMVQYLEGVTSVRSLLLFASKNITDSAVFHLTKLTNLEELKFIKSWGGSTSGVLRVTDASMRALGTMTQLRALDLGSTSVSDRGLAYLTGLTRLEKLTLPQRNITDEGLTHVSKLTRLKWLNTRGWTPSSLNETGPYTDAGLRELSRLSNLETLYISSGVGITDVGVSHLARLRKLQHLNMMCNGITDNALAFLSEIRTLRHLKLSTPNSAGITVSGVNQLNSLARLRFLKVSPARDGATLDLSNLTELETLSVSILDPTLRRSKGTLRDEDLAWLAGHQRLIWVQVGTGPTFSDAGMAHLAGLKRLERLGVGGNLVTDQGLSYLAGLKTINHLTVNGRFTAEGINHLQDLDGIRHLWVNPWRDLSPQEENYIRGVFPNLYSLNSKHLAGS